MSDGTRRIGTFFVVGLLLCISLLMRIPWLGTEHYASGDELNWGMAAKNLLTHPLLVLNTTHTMVPPANPTLDTRYTLWVRSSAFPLLIAVPIALLGPDHFSLRIVNCLFGVALVLLVFWLGRMTLGYAQGVAAALALATLPAAIMFSRMTYNENIVAVLALTAAGLAYRKKTVGGAWQASLVGVLVGYAYLVKAMEVLVIVMPALALLLIIRRDRKTWRWTAVAVAVAAAVVLLPLSIKAFLTPWTIPNTLNSLWFADLQSWKKPFVFYFGYLINEFSLLLPFIACGIISVLRRSMQPGADKRVLLSLAIASMIFAISVPTVKKDTYSMILMPAFALLAGEGMIFASNLKHQGKIWRTVGAAAMIGLPLLTIALGWTPHRRHGNFLMMGKDFPVLIWPVAMLVLLGINVIIVAMALSGRARKRLPAGMFAVFLVVSISLLSGGAAWLGLVDGQRDLNSHRRQTYRNWQGAAMAELQRDIKRLWPRRNLLVGGKNHARDVSFHNVSSVRIHHLELRSETRKRKLLKHASENLFPFYADSYPFIRNRSPFTSKWYRFLKDRYKDVTEWFRERYGVATSVKVYCLNHLDPASLDFK